MDKTIVVSMRKENGHSATAGRIVRWLAVALALLGCEDVPKVATFEPITDPRELFASVTFEHRAINLSTAAPYDTFRLTVMPRNALGEPMSGLPAPTFESSDTTRVQVTPEGLLRARRATDRGRPVEIVAKVIAENNIAHADTAIVHVTADPNPPGIQALRIAPDSASMLEVHLPTQGLGIYSLLHLAAGMPLDEVIRLMGMALIPQFFDESRRLIISGADFIAVAFRSSNPDALAVHPWRGELHPYRLEHARIVARSVVYGVEVSDSVDVQVVLPTHVGITIIEDEQGNLSLEPKEVALSPNATVLWYNTSERPVDIIFDRPEDVLEDPEFCDRLGGEFCDRGNIAAFAGEPIEGIGDLTNLLNAIRLRRLPKPGVYTYRSILTGLEGRLIVGAN